ncbi:hypothetical protein HED60_15090 [Planctomycetales bacterium ZRK34]|nr:hypothetical protein HED60_15090 [Planctomycetales bacterium ZRK34]
MNVATIQMPKEDAAAKLKDYRSQVHRRADDEYQQCAEAYAALAKGTPLIRLSDAIANAPMDDKGRPKLAICRADRRHVTMMWRRHETRIQFVASDTTWVHPNVAKSSTLNIFVDVRRTRVLENNDDFRLDGHAIVPMIPADVRETVQFAPRECFILWEVEQWADRPLTARPDIDPFLLRHVGGDLYAVLAAWELTEVERAVMAGRIDS